MRNFRNAVSWAAVESLSGAILSVVSLLIISRLVSPAEFGTIVAAQTVVGAIQLCLFLGMSDALIQRRPIDVLHYDSAFTSGLVLGVFGFVICLATANYFYQAEDERIFAIILAIEALSCIISGVNLVPEAVLQRKLRMKFLARRTLVSRLLYVLSVVVLAAAGAGLWSIVAAGVAQKLFNTIVLWSYTARFPKLAFSYSKWLELVRFGVPVALEGALWSAQGRIFLLLVGAIHGAGVLGLFTIAMRILEVIAGFFNGIPGRLGLAAFSQAADPARRNQLFHSGTSVIIFITAPIFVGLSMTAPEFVNVLLDEKWVEVVPIVQVLAVAWAVMFTRMLVGYYMKAIGHQVYMLLLAIPAATISIVTVFATAQLSIEHIAFAWASRIIVTYPIGVWLLYRYGGISVKLQFAPVWKPLIGAAIMAASLALLDQSLTLDSSASSLAGKVAVGSLIYIIYSALVYGPLLLRWYTRKPSEH